MAAESRIAVLAALVANFIIAILKLGAGLAAGSASMLAEAAHSFSDTGNQVLLLVGLARAKAEPSTQYPFGTGKSAYFWPFLVAVLLFGVAGAYSLFEGIEKVLHPHQLGDIRVSLGVLGAAFVIELVSLTIAFQQARKAARKQGIASVGQFLRENRDATLLTVLVEDWLALVGLPIAAGALVLAVATGNPVWDGMGSILIGVLLMGFALFLGYEVHQLLIGRGLSKRDRDRVAEVLVADPAVEAVGGVQSMYLGAHDVLLGVEVDLASGGLEEGAETVVDRLEHALRAELPALRFIFIEPRDGAGPLGRSPTQATAHGDSP